jgi:hypothetical protein
MTIDELRSTAYQVLGIKPDGLNVGQTIADANHPENNYSTWLWVKDEFFLRVSRGEQKIAICVGKDRTKEEDQWSDPETFPSVENALEHYKQSKGHF